MNNEEVLGEIAYLDTDLNEKSAGTFSSGEIVELVRDAIQLELAKQGQRKTQEMYAQFAALEKRMEAMRREFIRQRGTPSVVYVRRRDTDKISIHNQATSTVARVEVKVPKLMITFYTLGLVCSLTFATLLALSAMKVETIHPFLSLLGLIGSLGWLTTAWTDLLLWKRENPSAATNAATSEAPAVSSSNAR